jgi:WD40 repeat protein
VGHQNDVYAAAFGPDGQVLATGSGDGTVRLWDWQQGEVRHVLGTGGAPVWAVAFSADGQYLAAADEAGKIWVWNVTQVALLEATLRNESRVRALAFSPAGDRLVAGAEDGAAYLWDWKARDVRELHGHWGWIESVAFHPGGQYIATTGHDGTVRLWPASSEATISLACSRVSRDLGPEEWALYVGEIDYPAICPRAAEPVWVEANRLPPPGESIADRSAEEPPSPPTVFYFEAVPGTNVRPGDQVVLRWDLIGAFGVYLHTGEADAEGQGVAAPGEITVTPNETTVYRLRAINEAGETVKVLRILVGEGP